LSKIALRVRQEMTKYALNCSMDTAGDAAIKGIAMTATQKTLLGAVLVVACRLGIIRRNKAPIGRVGQKDTVIMRFFRIFFSLDGRINRVEFWVALVSIALFSILMHGLGRRVYAMGGQGAKVLGVLITYVRGCLFLAGRLWRFPRNDGMI
jgi:hypothetical protein